MALEIIIARETIQEAKQRLAGALLGSRQPADETVVEEVTEENFTDEEDVIYKMPEFAPEDAADVLAMMGQGGTISMSDLEPEV